MWSITTRPGCRWKSLRALHERIGPRIVNRDQGYRAFYGRFFAEIFGRTARTA